MPSVTTVSTGASRSLAASGTLKAGWIDDFCRRFSDATGWPVHFTPAEAEQTGELEHRLRTHPECCWWAAVEDGEQTRGFLHIDLPEHPGLDRSFLAVCELGELYAEMLTRVLTASHSLDSRSREVQTLVDLGTVVPQEDDLRFALARMLEAAVQLTGFRSAAFFLLDEHGERFRLRAVHEPDGRPVPSPIREMSGNPPDAVALRLGELVIDRDDAEATRWLPDDAALGVCVAVRSGCDGLGTLWVFDRRRRVPADRDFCALRSLAVQVAAMLERVVLLRESAEGHRMHRDLLAAARSQPRDAAVRLPAGSGLDVAAVCTSRFELGGDLCELIPLDERRTLIAVGDASGNGVPAAMVMAAARGALRIVSDAAKSPPRVERVIERINRVLHELAAPHQFMSLLCGVIDTQSRTFAYCNAGHPAPVLWQRGRARPLESHGLLLGILPDSTYSSSRVPLAPGDMLVFFSDGVSEAMNARREMFRSDGVIAALSTFTGGTARKLLQAIWSRLERHTAGEEGDDRTLLVVKLA